MIGFRLFYELGDAFQVFGIFDGIVAALRHNVREQLRHLFVKSRVNRSFIDDQTADIVLNGLCDVVPISLGASGQIVDGIRPLAQDQVDQADVVQMRDRLGIVCADIGVDKVPHRRFVELQIDGITAMQAHRVPNADRALHLFAHLGHFQIIETGSIGFGCDVGIGAGILTSQAIQGLAAPTFLLGIGIVLDPLRAGKVGENLIVALGLLDSIQQTEPGIAGRPQVIVCPT